MGWGHSEGGLKVLLMAIKGIVGLGHSPHESHLLVVMMMLQKENLKSVR
jgi:hypothetical protein